MDDHQLKEENESAGEWSYSLLTNCSEMSVFGSYWETWYFVICEQACACYNKMTTSCDKRLARLISYIPAILLCGKHSTTLQAWIVSRLWFWAGDLEHSKSTSAGVLVYFRESHVCANKLDVQETDLSFTLFHRSRVNFSRCKFTHGR